MGTLNREIKFFGSVYGKLQKNVRNTLDVETRVLRDRISRKSPVRTGRYKRSWRVNKTRGTGTIANSMILNPLKQASALEFGIDPQEFPSHPWVVSFVEGGSSGVDMQDGLVWSAKAVGGTMLPEFNKEYKDKLTKVLANSAIQAFK